MASDLFRAPDENSGPALLDREPVLLPKQRKELAQQIKNLGNN